MTTELEMSTVGTGSLRSPDDYRYINVAHLAGAAPLAATLPTSYHIDFSNVPDLYQRKIGACTAHATAEIAMHRLARLGTPKRISARFIYAMSKINDNIADQTEQGTYCNQPLKVGVAFGYATEDFVPNDTTLDFDSYIYGRDIRKMPAGTFENASENRIPGYVQVGSFNSINASQLMQGLQKSMDGVKTCLPVGAEWYTGPDGVTSWDPAKILPIRKMVTQISGHDITVTGMDVETGSGRWKVFFRNHWSIGWANQDNGWFYLDQHTLSEAWIVTEIPDPLLAIVKSLPARANFAATFPNDIKPGQTSDDVKNLQIAMKIFGTFPFTQPVTNYFGNITRQAVMQFQTEYKVASPADIAAAGGVVGPKTRETINSLLARK